MKKHVLSAAALLILSLTVSTPALAGWTVTYLHPAEYDDSGVSGSSGTYQAGYAFLPNQVMHSAMWNGTAANFIDLNPAGCSASQGYDISGTQVVGKAWGTATASNWHASLWNGTAGSWIDLNPAGSRDSLAYGICGNQQVGYATVQGFAPGVGTVWYGHAALWNGTSSWVDLSPFAQNTSQAEATSGTQQVGYVGVGSQLHASLWSGTAASWVDLNPIGSTYSRALGVYGGQQVGCVEGPTTNGQRHAAIWSGSAASWLDLNPVGYGRSVALDTRDEWQVGWGSVSPTGENYRACLWNGTAGSWVDLHGLLGADFTQSTASGIEIVDGELWISGSAENRVTNRTEAVLWRGVVPEPSSFLMLLSGLGMVPFIRRRR